MQHNRYHMKPQDVLLLLKLIALDDPSWQQVPVAKALHMSQGEISQSASRLKFARLLDGSGKQIMRQTFMDFIQFGLAVVFPVQPGPVVRGLPTAHAAAPLSALIQSSGSNYSELFVWPHPFGEAKGQAIQPLYRSVPEAALSDPELYALLALCDAVRACRTREKSLALGELQRRIVGDGGD
ncbi:hypothetical protein CYPRO_1115 [Cyclonatronum proteinivorum]|uniref:Uncharacterized protein n=1 Tax=Cyclonatronum proteinivorum TaxID=1457365 RepID=A0A345UIS8_9BACT|nr:hypothetical protein [Cyclonatronum proteinivorum]AXJ00380.1 hypothetical protein CYPRO_1115 [Cyclonatronum proteinivorum]